MSDLLYTVFEMWYFALYFSYKFACVYVVRLKEEQFLLYTTICCVAWGSLKPARRLEVSASVTML